MQRKIHRRPLLLPFQMAVSTLPLVIRFRLKPPNCESEGVFNTALYIGGKGSASVCHNLFNIIAILAHVIPKHQ